MINIEKLQNLLLTKALPYEEMGGEHFPIEAASEPYKQTDISAHLHCEVVELWLAIVQNQSLEQVADELADILCIWNLALVLYQKSNGHKIDVNKIVDEAYQQIKTDNYLNLIPDARKNWQLREYDLKDDFTTSIDESINRNKIRCVFNLGNGNEIDIFSLYHKVVNDLWNSIRKNKGLDEIYQNLVIIFAVWLLSIRVISNHMKYEISIDNILEIASDIFSYVAKKKYNINI